jgi:hypothetical protein
MKDSEDLFKVFTGNEASAILLKGQLEGIGVSAMIKDDSMNAFLGAATGMEDLYIRKSDIPKAIETINEFIKTNTGN